jgi:cytochrome P450
MKPLPPGKLGLPWLGETLAIAKNNHGFYKDRFAKYGPVFKTRLFGHNFVVLSGPEAFHRYVTDPVFERGGKDPISVQQIFFGSLAVVDGIDHRTRKSAMLTAYTRDAIEAYLPKMQRVIAGYAARWEKAGTVTLQPQLQLMSASLAGTMFLADESDEATQQMSDVAEWMRGAFMTLPVAIPFTKYAKAVKGRDQLLQIIDRAFARHRSGSYNDSLSRILEAAARLGVPDSKLRSDVLHQLFAGQGGYFTVWTLLTMAMGQQPELIERARQEVMDVSPDGPITMEHLDRMEYIERLSRETRRKFMLNSATFFGRALADVDIGNYRIPKGWGAIAAIHITMRNPDVWADPEKFDPDRFLPERIAARPAGSYVPHGDGPRGGHKCPAEDIVAVGVKLYLAMMLRRMTFELPPQDLTLKNELFPLPKSDLVVKFKPHGARAPQYRPEAEGAVRR